MIDRNQNSDECFQIRTSVFNKLEERHFNGLRLNLRIKYITTNGVLLKEFRKKVKQN
jgi:hypothetical protein